MLERLLANLVFNLAAAAWVALDAWRRRARKPAFAAALALLWGPLGLAFYAADRPLAAGEVRRGGTAWTMATTFAGAWTLLVPLVFVLARPVLAYRAAVPASLGDRYGVTAATLIVTAAFWIGGVLLALGVGTALRRRGADECGTTTTPAGLGSPLVGAGVAAALALAFALAWE